MREENCRAARMLVLHRQGSAAPSRGPCTHCPAPFTASPQCRHVSNTCMRQHLLAARIEFSSGIPAAALRKTHQARQARRLTTQLLQHHATLGVWLAG